jgi:hypothetical protein
LSKSDEIRQAKKFDHERLPSYISNSLELVSDILKRSEEYGIHGNIDLDQGYSFLYQIAIFFPMQFQKQVIKTTFRPYDGNPAPDEYSTNVQSPDDFPGQTPENIPLSNLIRGVKDKTEVEEGEGEGDEKLNKVPMLTPLDSVSDLKLNAEYKNITSLQLKCSDWLHLEYNCANSENKKFNPNKAESCSPHELIPQVKNYMKKQAAYLNTDNPIDLLLQASYNMTCGVQDISVMNAILEDISKKHQL